MRVGTERNTYHNALTIDTRFFELELDLTPGEVIAE